MRLQAQPSSRPRSPFQVDRAGFPSRARHAPVGLAPGQGTAGFVSLTSRESLSPIAHSRPPRVTSTPPAFPAASILDPHRVPRRAVHAQRPAHRLRCPLRAALRLRTPGTLQLYCTSSLIPSGVDKRDQPPANHVGPGQTDAARNAKRAPGHSPRGPLTCRQLYRGV